MKQKNDQLLPTYLPGVGWLPNRAPRGRETGVRILPGFYGGTVDESSSFGRGMKWTDEATVEVIEETEVEEIAQAPFQYTEEITLERADL